MTLDPKRHSVRVEYWRPDGTLESVVETDGKQAARLSRIYADDETIRVEKMAANSRAVCTCGKIYEWTLDGLDSFEIHVYGPGACPVASERSPADLSRLGIWCDWQEASSDVRS